MVYNVVWCVYGVGQTACGGRAVKHLDQEVSCEALHCAGARQQASLGDPSKG